MIDGVASRAAAQVCHTSQGQDERVEALPRHPRHHLPPQALTWRGSVRVTRTGRGRGRGLAADGEQTTGSSSAPITFGRKRRWGLIGATPAIRASLPLLQAVQLLESQLGVSTGHYLLDFWMMVSRGFLGLSD